MMQSSRNRKNFSLLALGGIIILLLLVITILSVYLGLSSSGRGFNGNKRRMTCETKACITAANDILKNVDESVDPCEDFNKFTCGGFLNNVRIPDDKSKHSTFSMLRNTLIEALSGR
jgi:ABC-type antimicrobial peptide transport system permease subunit